MSVAAYRLANIDWRRALRLLKYGLVGASGIPVDMAIVWLIYGVGGGYYLTAQIVAFAVAVSWNFGLNYHWTFDSPEGSLLRQYLGYISVQVLALATRLVIVVALVEALAAPVMVATAIGILLPAVLGFVGVERVFGRGTDG